MTRLRTLWGRILLLFGRSGTETELDEEIRSHLEMQEEENRRDGMNAEQARQAALRDFGGVDQVKERYRDRYRFPTIETLLQDLGYASSGCAALVEDRNPNVVIHCSRCDRDPE